MGWGRRIRQAREELGLSQRALGERINASQQTVADYEGQHTDPGIDVLARIAGALGVNPAWLAFEIGDKAPGEKSTLDRQLMERTIFEYERFVTKKRVATEPISPQKKATLLIFAYDLAEQAGGPENLEPVLERLFALATNG